MSKHTPITDTELDEMEKEVKCTTKGPWLTPREAGDPYDKRVPLDHEGCNIWPWAEEEDMVFAYNSRINVPRLIAEVRALRKGHVK